MYRAHSLFIQPIQPILPICVNLGWFEYGPRALPEKPDTNRQDMKKNEGSNKPLEIKVIDIEPVVSTSKGIRSNLK